MALCEGNLPLMRKAFPSDDVDRLFNTKVVFSHYDTLYYGRHSTLSKLTINKRSVLLFDIPFISSAYIRVYWIDQQMITGKLMDWLVNFQIFRK